MSTPRSELLAIGKSSEVYRQVTTIIAQQIEAEAILNEEKTQTMSSAQLKNLGITFNESSHYEEAKIYLTLALEKLPQETTLSQDEKICITAECLHGLANGKRELGQDEEAIKGYTAALEECKKIKT